MLVSFLTLSLEHDHGNSSDAVIDRVARYVAEHNTTVVAIAGCHQSVDGEALPDDADYGADESINTSNTAYRLQQALQAYSMKYSLAWAARSSADGGVAVLTQLSILGVARRRWESASPALAVELALSPNALLDVFCAGSSGDENADLAGFIADAPAMIDASKPPPKPRRGAPPRKPAKPKPQPMRMAVFLGAFPSTQGFLAAGDAVSPDGLSVAIRPGVRALSHAGVAGIAQEGLPLPVTAEYEL